MKISPTIWSGAASSTVGIQDNDKSKPKAIEEPSIAAEGKALVEVRTPATHPKHTKTNKPLPNTKKSVAN
jgi:hypothetical protein